MSIIQYLKRQRQTAGPPEHLQVADGANSLLDGGVAQFCRRTSVALSLQQGASGRVTPGSDTVRLAASWYGRLIRHRIVLMSYDRDEAARLGTKRLLTCSPRFRKPTTPRPKDIPIFQMNGGDISAWLRFCILEGVTTP